MKFAHHQAINTLIKERIGLLHSERLHQKTAIKSLSDLSTPETLEGSLAYTSLNEAKNIVRSTNRKLKKWREVHAAFLEDMGLAQDDENAWVRINDPAGSAYLAGLMQTLAKKDE